jgi:hypothetical protein
MHDPVATGREPAPVGRRQAEVDIEDVAGDHDRLGQPSAQLAIPEIDHLGDSIRGPAFGSIAHQRRDTDPPEEQVTQDIAAEQTGRARQQVIRPDLVIASNAFMSSHLVFE